MNTITRSEVLETLTTYFYPYLRKTEDFESFTQFVSKEIRSLSRDALSQAIEVFDGEIRSAVPSP